MDLSPRRIQSCPGNTSENYHPLCTCDVDRMGRNETITLTLTEAEAFVVGLSTLIYIEKSPAMFLSNKGDSVETPLNCPIITVHNKIVEMLRQTN